MTNGDLSLEQLKKYKKIFVRHLKEDGIYIAVRRTFIKRNITFNQYMTEKKKDSDVIAGAVDTLWSIASSSIGGFRGNANVTASLFMIGLLTDSDFKELFDKHIYRLDKVISDMVKSEINYLFNSSLEDDWSNGRISSDIAEKLNNFIICNNYGSIITSRNQSLINCCRFNNK